MSTEKKFVVMNDKLKSAELIPGSYGLPIIGELIDFLVKREEFYSQLAPIHRD